VVDASGELVGIMDFKTILRVLIPEIAGGLSARLEALGVSIAFAQADTADLDELRLSFRARVIKNAETKIRDMMLKVRGTIDANADLIEALKLMYRNKITVLPVYDDGKLIGVLRESDLFLCVADILME
jgi:CBS domain-containing protein